MSGSLPDNDIKLKQNASRVQLFLTTHITCPAFALKENPTSPLGAVDGFPGPLGVVSVHCLDYGSEPLPVDVFVYLGESVAESADLLVGLAEDVRCEGVHGVASVGFDL